MLKGTGFSRGTLKGVAEPSACGTTFLRACGACLSADWLAKHSWLKGKEPRNCGGRFSRRGALCAPARTDLVQTEASRNNQGVNEWPEALGGICLGGPDAVITGVRSPPLRGVDHPGEDGLAGKDRGWRARRFSRRGALCAPAKQGRARAEAHLGRPGDGVASRGREAKEGGLMGEMPR